MPAPVELVNADPLGTEDIIPASMPIPAAASAVHDALPVGTASGGAGGLGFLPALAGAAFPVFHSGSDHTPIILGPGPGPSPGPGPGGPAVNPVNPLIPVNPVPTPYSEPTTPVPEPSAAFLLLGGLFAILMGKRLIT